MNLLDLCSKIKIAYLVIFFVHSFAIGQDLTRSRQVIDSLCSPAMHGRGYVQAGERKAGDFIYKNFQEIGLKPFKLNYYQFFKLDVNTFPNRLSLKIGKHKLKVGEDFIINPISRSGKGRAKIWLFDTLLLSQAQTREAFLNENMRKKIAVLSEKQFHQILQLPQKVIDKIYEAKALIELKKSKLTATLANQGLSSPFFEIRQTLFDSLASQNSKIKYKLDATFYKDYTSQNIIGYLQGTAEPDTFMVFTAHYDHLGRMGKDTYFAGANDNAAGVAMLLELARYFVKNPPKYSVAFMAFGAEEIGLLGSKFYTQYPLFPLDRIRFLMNMDLIGTGDDGVTIVNGSIYKAQYQLLTSISEQKKYISKINARGFAANSDHYYFSANKVPSFFIYTLGGVRAYHDIYDVPHTLPLTKFKEIFSLLRDFGEAIMK